MIIDKETIKALLNSKVIEKIYHDSLSMPLKEVSKIVTWIIKTAQLPFYPFQLAASYQERLEHRLKNSVEQVDEENMIAPPASILIPIINQLSYLEDGNILIGLFQNLLARAMDKTRNSEAHPGFIVIINQLSPDEAHMLYELKFNKLKYTHIHGVNKQGDRFLKTKIESNDFQVKKLIFENNFDMYIEHLEKLNLVHLSEARYEIMDDAFPNKKIGRKRIYTVALTKFGNLFVKACLPD